MELLSCVPKSVSRLDNFHKIGQAITWCLEPAREFVCLQQMCRVKDSTQKMVRCQHDKSVSRSSQQEPISVKQAGKAAHLSWMQMPDLASAGLWHGGDGGKIQVSTTNWCQGFKEEISQMFGLWKTLTWLPKSHLNKSKKEKQQYQTKSQAVASFKPSDLLYTLVKKIT